MSKRAEEAALKAYPGQLVTTCARGNRFHAGPLLRIGFVNGYEAAEKDLALTWEDIRKIVTLFSEVSYECFDYMSANEFCEETLRRYKEAKQ